MITSLQEHFCLHSWKVGRHSDVIRGVLLYCKSPDHTLLEYSRLYHFHCRRKGWEWCLTGFSIRTVINKQTERGHCEQEQSENFAKLTPEMLISVSGLVMVTVNKRPGHLSPHYSIDCNPGPHLLGWHWELAPVCPGVTTWSVEGDIIFWKL